jgi:uncharacterized protein (TIGR02996 family)
VTEDELVAAVRADPDDDGPRLVYADWLSDRGDPRGELIGLHCKMARLPSRGAAHKAYQVEAQRLLVEQEAELARELEGIVTHWRWRRGFVAELTLLASSLVEHGEKIFKLAPLVTELRLTGEIDGARLAGTPFLRGIRVLDVSQMPLGPEGIAALAAAGLTIESLTANHCGATDEGALALATGDLPLLALSLEHNRIGSAGVRALLQMPRLITLRLRGNYLGELSRQLIDRFGPASVE